MLAIASNTREEFFFCMYCLSILLEIDAVCGTHRQTITDTPHFRAANDEIRTLQNEKRYMLAGS